jgi:hypothetical protein
MIKFNDVLAKLAVALDEPIGEFAELLRVLRLTATDADDGRKFDWWHGARLKTMVRGRYGPNGGIEVNPATVGYFLTACLIDGPRREIAAKAFDLQFAPAPLTPRGQRTVCAKTGETRFGPALVKVLTDRKLFDDLIELSVCTKLGLAMLIFKDTASPMFITEHARISKDVAGIHRTTALRFDKIRFLFDLINQPETAIA